MSEAAPEMDQEHVSYAGVTSLHPKPAPAPRRDRRDRPDRTAFGRRMRARRKELRMTQTELAQRIRMIRNNVSRLETGWYEPSTVSLVHVAKALCCSTDYLLGLKDNP